MGATEVLGHDLDVLVAKVPVRVFVLDANVGEMHLVVEVRQVVFTSPSRDLGLAPVRPAVAVAIAAIGFMEKALIVALQLAVQLHPIDARALIAEALGSLQVSPIKLRVMAALAGPIGTGMELLMVAGVLGTMPFEERTAAVREGDCTFLVIHRNTLDEPLLFEVAEVAIADITSRITRVAQVALEDDTECPP